MNCRFIFLQGLMLLMLPLSGCVETTAPLANGGDVGTTHFVQVNALNLRECSSTKCRIIAVLEQGTPVTVLNVGSGWLEVQVRDSRKTGWVSARYVGMEQPSEGVAKTTGAKNTPELPEEEFAPATLSSTGPPVAEEFGLPVGAGQQEGFPEPPPVREEFAR